MSMMLSHRPSRLTTLNTSPRSTLKTMSLFVVPRSRTFAFRALMTMPENLLESRRVATQAFSPSKSFTRDQSPCFLMIVTG